MARKDRAPTPPKRVQAPARRSSTPAGSSDSAGGRRTLLLGLGAAGLVVVAIVLGVLFLGGDSQSEAAVLEEEGCTLETFAGQEGRHLDDPEAKPKWNSSPPTSGPHSPTPAVYGFYTEPVSLLQSVHNLEHGGIVIHLGEDVPEETVDEIRGFYERDPNGLLVAALPELGDKIALTAWTARETGDQSNGRGYLATCTGFSERAFSTFLSEHRYKGPERFPEDSLRPGST